MSRPLEMCQICDSETGHSGKGDDSLYGELNYPIWEMLELTAGDEVGPLCYRCYSSLQQIEYIDQD